MSTGITQQELFEAFQNDNLAFITEYNRKGKMQASLAKKL